VGNSEQSNSAGLAGASLVLIDRYADADRESGRAVGIDLSRIALRSLSVAPFGGPRVQFVRASRKLFDGRGLR
jgi:hypothetical protein